VLCVGASHALGGTTAALTALAGAAPAGSRLLFGDGYWETAPSAAAVEMFGEDVRPLAGLLEACRSAGWRVLHLSVADQREWDDFESSFRAGRQEWLLAHAADPRAAEVRDWLDDRERQYVEVYRGVLGFAYLVLAQEEVIGLAPDDPEQSAPEQSAEDTDAGWGERPDPGEDERLYGERPPHWE
jgi:hypothetical protein